MMDGNSIDVEVETTTKISALKEMLEVKVGVDVSRQRLIYTGKVLSDDQDLASYSVNDGDALHLVVRPVNVPPSPTPSVSAPSPVDQQPSGADRPTQSQTSFPLHFENLGNGVIVGAMTMTTDDASEENIHRIISQMVQSTPQIANPSSLIHINQVPSPSVSAAMSATDNIIDNINIRQAIPTNTLNNTYPNISSNISNTDGISVNETFGPNLESSLSSIEALVGSLEHSIQPSEMLEDLSELDTRNYPASSLSTTLWEFMIGIHGLQLPLLQAHNDLRDLA
eukprot:gene5850-11817_t